MGFLFQKAKTPNIPEFTGLQVQTAVNALPIPIIYGCPRTSWNLIYANGFTAVAQKSGGKGGGKGLLTGGKGSTTGYKYYASFICAIGEGPITDILVIFDDAQVYDLDTIPINSGKVYNFFNGTTDNTIPWAYITDLWPADAFTYKDTCYLGCDNYPLDSSATVPQLNFVPQGILAGSSPLNLFTAPSGAVFLLDADPAQVIVDFLTNSTYGAGFPLSYVDTTTLLTSSDGFNPAIGDAAVSTYCQAVGLAWSVVLNNFEPASSILERWCKNLVVAPVWTGYSLKFIPYYDSANGDNPNWDSSSGIAEKYFQPNVTPLFDLTDDDFIQSSQEEDPVTVSRIDLADVKNVFRLDFRDRFNLFNSNIGYASDENQIELYGPRVDRMGTADEFSIANYADTSCQLQLQRSIAIRNTYTWKMNWGWCILDPMDIVTLSDEILGLNKFPVRIISIEEDEKGILTFTAEEFPLGAATSTLYTRASNSPPQTFLTNNPAPSVNTPFIFEPTQPMIIAQGGGNPVIVIGASGGPSGTYSPDWGGCNVYVSNDNVSYDFLGIITGPSRQGVTTANLAAYSSANPDNTNTLSVNVTESNAEFDSVTSAQAAGGLTLCAIIDSAGDFELLAYTTATLVTTGNYNLTGLYRGLYGTVACSHLSGAQFLRVDNDTFEAQLPPNFVDQQLYIKLASFNTYGNELQSLSTCTVYTYTPTGAGTNINNDPIIAALLAGTSVDLNSANDPYSPIDLNLGGSNSCSPTLLTIDLGTN